MWLMLLWFKKARLNEVVRDGFDSHLSIVGTWSGLVYLGVTAGNVLRVRSFLWSLMNYWNFCWRHMEIAWHTWGEFLLVCTKKLTYAVGVWPRMLNGKWWPRTLRNNLTKLCHCLMTRYQVIARPALSLYYHYGSMWEPILRGLTVPDVFYQKNGGPEKLVFLAFPVHCGAGRKVYCSY